MNILLIETTTSNCQIALKCGNKLVQVACEGMRNHSKVILPFIDQLLKDNAIQIKDLDYIAFATGPGSFTGMRLGLACVQAIHLVHKTPLISLSTLKLLAASFLFENRINHVSICQDAKMGELYYAVYEQNENKISELHKDTILKPDQLATYVIEDNTTLIGDGWQLLSNAAKLNFNSNLTINMQVMENLTQQHIANDEYLTNISDIELNYLRDASAWK